MTQFAKKKEKFFFELFDPKKFYHPRWGDPQWAKIEKKNFFSIFRIRMTQFAKKIKKNFFSIFSKFLDLTSQITK